MISNLEENLKKFETNAKVLGEAQGEKRKAKEIAKDMLRDGLDHEFITKYTKLTKEEIQKLKDQLN